MQDYKTASDQIKNVKKKINVTVKASINYSKTIKEMRKSVVERSLMSFSG